MSNSRQILITGGCGYLGSITSQFFKTKGFEPLIIDNFSTSHKGHGKPAGKIFEADLTDFATTEKIIGKLGPIHAVIHFAAHALVPESVAQPLKYFHNNLNAALTIAECTTKYKIPYLIHSSSCAVYGLPTELPIKETQSQSPLSPYGETKVLVERLLNQYSHWKGFQVLHLRYFNPAGADLASFNGEQHDPETHLIPNLIAHFEKQTTFEVFGTDYPTSDGTCVRDFIHVKDLAEAHFLALNFLENHSQIRQDAFNIGSGKGTSVKELIAASAKVFGESVKTKWSDRRAGDPPELVADISKMKKEFGWQPRHSLEDMIKDHWQFYRSISKR